MTTTNAAAAAAAATELVHIKPQLGALAQLRRGLLVGELPLGDGDQQQVLPGHGGEAAGQRQLLAFTRTVLSRPDVWLLDEPTAGMSPAERRQAVDLLLRIRRDNGVTLMLTEHDMDVVFSVADVVTVMVARVFDTRLGLATGIATSGSTAGQLAMMPLLTLGFVALGQTVALITGGIDLSVGPLAGFCATTARDPSYFELYLKPSYNITDSFNIGANAYWSPNWNNYKFQGTYLSGTAKYTFGDSGFSVSGEFGRVFLGSLKPGTIFNAGPASFKYRREASYCLLAMLFSANSRATW